MLGWIWPIVLVVGEFAIKVALILHILLRRQPRTGPTLAWVMLIVAIPVVGVVGYLLLGERRLGRRRVRRHGEIRQRQLGVTPEHRVAAAPAWEAIAVERRPIARLAEAVGEKGPKGGNSITLLSDTDDFIDAMVTDIDAAADHCHLLFYIFLVDPSGTKVAEALMRAADRGVACRLLVDAVGSRDFMNSSLVGTMRQAGVQVVEALHANVVRMLFARIDLRNHRKIAIMDGRIAYTGSHNIAAAEFAVKKRYAPWCDAGVRIEGPAAHDLQSLFVEDWYLDTNESLEEMLRIPPAPGAEGMIAQVMGTGPNSYNEAMRQLTLMAVQTAREELVLTTPYFVPDDATATGLCMAARRGVRTSLIVPERNDSPLVAAASRSFYELLLESGVQIHEFQQGLLHAKTMTVDREVGLITTANLDRRSFELNFEVSVLVFDSDFASQLRFLQTSYLNDSKRVELRAWHERGWRHRLWQNTAGILSPLL